MMNKKDLIIDKSIILFTKKGYYGVGLQEILSACDIPKGSFYYYFPKGKKQLLLEVLEKAYSSMEESIKNRFSKYDLKNSCLSMIDVLSKKLTEDKYFQSLTMSFLAIESVYLDKEINDKCIEIYTRWQKLYYEKFLSSGYDSQAALEKAQCIFALIHGSLISSWIKQDAKDLKLIKKSVEKVIDN